MSTNGNVDTSFMTEDQLRAYNDIKAEYEESGIGISVAPVEGSDKVVITSTTDSNSNMFEIYLPAKIDENTKSYTYYNPCGITSRGASGSYVVDNAITNAIDENNDAIFCMTSSDDKNELGLRTIEAIYGENAFNSHTCIGWSEGGGTVYTRTLDKIRNNPDLEPQTMVFLDLQWNGGQLDTSEENLNLMKENGTVIMAFESVETLPDQYKTSQHYKEIAAAGIPLVIIEIPGDHGETPATVFQDNLLAFLNGQTDEIPSALGFYKFDENGNFVPFDDVNEAIRIMRQNLISEGKIPTFTPEQIDDMYEKYKKEYESYNMYMRESLDNINGMMSEFLTTDAGFLAEKIQALTSKINGTKIKNLKITADYASTTNSPKIQDVKIMEYVAKTSEILFKTLECVEFAMHAQIEIESTEDNIKDRAEDLAGGRSTTDAALAGAIAGLGAAADALGYTGAKKQEYIDSETAKLFEKYYGEEANKEAESKGLSGKDKDKFIDDYIKGRIDEFEKNKDEYDVDVETEVSETDLKGNEVKDEQEKVDEANMSSTVNKNIKYDDAKKPSEEKGNSDVKASNAKENTKLNNGNNKDRRDNSTNQSNNDSNKSNASSTVNADKTEVGPKDSKDENKPSDTNTNNNQNNSGNTGGTGNVSNSNSNTGSNTSSSGSSSGNSGYSPSAPSAPSNPDIIDSGTLTPSNDTVEFPEYSSVVSDTNTDVYSSLDSSYKIIINHDNNSVTSVEHYFDFGNPDKALSSLNKITQGYSSDMIKSIKCEGQYVKVIFKDSYFNTSSYHDFISKFDGFNKITK